ncbi:MAG: HK97 family phage prohead protease [Bacteroidales bacterium]|nr:HK97 family phage prohead protease [Bacteroidales bacterium]
MKEVVISSSRLNSYGFRVLTEGIDTEQYKKNPILLWMHNRPFRGTTDEVLPLGRIENLRVEGDKLIGTPVFDESDSFAVQIKNKWEKGILKMVSAGLDVIELSEADEDVVIGQTRKTVKRSKLVEVSIVDIGANDDALALYDDKKERITLSLGDNCGIEKLTRNTDKNREKMKEIALALGLFAEACKEDILQEIAKLKKVEEERVELKKEVEKMQSEAIDNAVDNAVKLRKITQDKKAEFVELGKQIGVEKLSKVFDSMSSAVKPMDVIRLSEDQKSEVKKLSDLSDEEKVKLREEDLNEYKRLYKAEYGVECVIEK